MAVDAEMWGESDLTIRSGCLCEARSRYEVQTVGDWCGCACCVGEVREFWVE